MGAPSRVYERLDRQFYKRPGHRFSDPMRVLGLAFYLCEWDLHFVRDLHRLTKPQVREAHRLLTMLDPPLGSAIPLHAVADGRPR